MAVRVGCSVLVAPDMRRSICRSGSDATKKAVRVVVASAVASVTETFIMLVISRRLILALRFERAAFRPATARRAELYPLIHNTWLYPSAVFWDGG